MNNSSSPEANMSRTLPGGNSTQVECLNPLQYDVSDQRCHSVLMNALAESGCPYNARQTLSVVINGQELARQVIFGLEFIGASESYLAEAISLICLYAYGLCGTSGVYIQPTSSQCEELRDSLCQTEWATAVGFGIALPNCNELPSTLASCSEMDEINSSMISNTSIEATEDDLNLPTSMTPECSEGFYRENGSQICIPSCYSWNQYERNLSIATDVSGLAISIIGLIAGIFILIVACCKPKRMCKFPGTFVLYMVVDTLIVELLVIVGFMDRPGLFCSDESLFESLKKVTPFCVITGSAFVYGLLQISTWWLFHILILFWMVFFPFQSQRYKLSRKIHYIHIACVLIGLIFPLTPVITSMSDHAIKSQNNAGNDSSAVELFLSGGLGYSMTRFPSYVCNPSDGGAAFYSFALPLAIIQATGSTALVIILWRVRRQSVNKKKSSMPIFHFGTAEKKLLIIFFYFEILAGIALITLTLHLKIAAEFVQSIFDFFLCEQRGNDPEHPCSREEIHRLSYPILTLLSYVILGFFAVVLIVYAVDVEEIKKKLAQKKSRKRERLNASSFNSSMTTKTSSFSMS